MDDLFYVIFGLLEAALYPLIGRRRRRRGRWSVERSDARRKSIALPFRGRRNLRVRCCRRRMCLERWSAWSPARTWARAAVKERAAPFLPAGVLPPPQLRVDAGPTVAQQFW